MVREQGENLKIFFSPGVLVWEILTLSAGEQKGGERRVHILWTSSKPSLEVRAQGLSNAQTLRRVAQGPEGTMYGKFKRERGTKSDVPYRTGSGASSTKRLLSCVRGNDKGSFKDFDRIRRKRKGGFAKEAR